MQSLCEKYWEQRIEYINEHFDVLEGQLTEIMRKFEDIQIEIEEDEEIKPLMNKASLLLASFSFAIYEYLQKVPFKDPPYMMNPDLYHCLPSVYNASEIIRNYKSKYEVQIPQTMENVAKELSCAHRFITKATQLQREQVFVDALDLIKQAFPQQNLAQPEKSSVSTRQSMFGVGKK